MTVDRGVGLLTAVEQAADRFADPVDGFVDDRFGTGDAVHHFFGGLAYAGLFKRPAEHVFVDAGLSQHLARVLAKRRWPAQ